MNHSNKTERLDEAIDSLLKSKPLQAPDTLGARIMATVKHEAAAPAEPAPGPTRRGKLWSFALPLAAALTLAAFLWPSLQSPQTTPSLSFEQTQEIIELEESLRALVPLQEAGDFSINGLLVTLETATYAL